MRENAIIAAGIVLLLLVGAGVYFYASQGGSAPPLTGNPAGSAPSAAQPASRDPSAPQPPVLPAHPLPNMSHLITIKTTLGDIQFATYDADAPLASENFIALAQKGFYNGVIFHRVIKGFMIQGGDPAGTGTGGPGYAFADELYPTTASYQAGYVRGVVAMANAGPNTNGSQFFIMLADTPLPHNYTIFGKVVKGQDVVDAIGNLPTDQNDRPLTPPSIERVTVEAQSPAK